MTLALRRVAWPTITVVVVALLGASLLVGGYDITLTGIFTDPAAREMFFISRVPRTLALVFAAMAMSICGVIMQMITQNKFVEPTTAGTSQWAGLGLLVVLLVMPGAPPLARMAVASLFAFVGTMAFLAILRRVGATESIIVPLVGIMLGAVVGALTPFLAGRFNLLQSMSAWRSGGFSSIVRGFYEPLWAVLLVAVIARSPPTSSASPGSDARSPPTSGWTTTAPCCSAPAWSRWPLGSPRWWLASSPSSV